jgi:hypothetical protein
LIESFTAFIWSFGTALSHCKLELGPETLSFALQICHLSPRALGVGVRLRVKVPVQAFARRSNGTLRHNSMLETNRCLDTTPNVSLHPINP